MKTEEFLYGRNEELHNELVRLRAVNTELVAAAKRCLVHGVNEYEAEDQLRTAIAKASEGTK